MSDERDLELDRLRLILDNTSGRAFLYACLQNCYTYESTFSEDPIKHAYRAGARAHGLWLDAELREACIDRYLLMIKENR